MGIPVKIIRIVFNSMQNDSGPDSMNTKGATLFTSCESAKSIYRERKRRAVELKFRNGIHVVSDESTPLREVAHVQTTVSNFG